MIIRPERLEDYDEVYQVVKEACFEKLSEPDIGIAPDGLRLFFHFLHVAQIGIISKTSPRPRVSLFRTNLVILYLHTASMHRSRGSITERIPGNIRKQ